MRKSEKMSLKNTGKKVKEPTKREILGDLYASIEINKAYGKTLNDIAYVLREQLPGLMEKNGVIAQRYNKELGTNE